jgi:hypothetical protein
MNHLSKIRGNKWGFLIMLLLLCGCAQPQAGPAQPAPTTAPAVIKNTPTKIILPPTVEPSASPTGTPLPTLTLTLTPAPSLTPTPPASATPIPTYVKLRGEVVIDQAVCHYGPGAPYLYKYGVYKGSNLEVLRRMAGGNYIEVQAIGGNNPCWVRVDYLKLKGDPSSLEPVQIEDISLPPSPYYTSPGGVSTQRNGTLVTVSWNALQLRAGDDSEQTPYIVEAVVCQQGQLVFVPAGSYKTSLTLEDEPGCSAPSHAWFVAAEKHGYTHRAEVPWPPVADIPK